MLTLEEVGRIIFNNEYWKGGNGGNFKAPYNNNAPKPFEEAKQYRYICGVIQEFVVMVDIDDETGIMFGDSGNCTFLISREALQKCDFSEVEYDWQCC